MERLTQEQKNIIEENYNLIYSFLHKHLKEELQKGEEHVQAVKDALEDGLIKAAQYYDPEKGKFSTIAYQCMRTEIGMLFRRTGKYHHYKKWDFETSLNELIDSDEDNKGIQFGEEEDGFYVLEKEEKAKETSDILEKLSQVMSSQELKIISQLKGGASYSKIGEALGISRQSVSNRMGDIRKKARIIMQREEANKDE